MQAYLSLIRDIFVICTTSVTVLGIFAKILNNLFLDIIKRKYRNIPGKQALFDTVFKSIVYTGLVISVIVTFTRLGTIILYGQGNVESNKQIVNNTIQIIAAFAALLLFILIACTYRIFLNMYKRLDDELNIKYGDCGRSKNVGKKHLKGLIIFFYKHIKGINIISQIIALFYFGISIIFIGILFLNGIKSEYLSSVITLVLISLVCISMFIILNSLMPVFEMLEKKSIYRIVTKSETIMAYYFFDYEGYYLIIQNCEERYISKGEIKEIIKIKELSWVIIVN